MSHNDVFEVETLLAKRQRTVRGRARTEYLVKWAGYAANESTWEPRTNLHKDIILAYEVSLEDSTACEIHSTSLEHGAAGELQCRKRRRPAAPLDPTHVKCPAQEKPNRSREEVESIAAQEERIQRSIRRSQEPVVKRTGKPVMFRSQPIVRKKKVVDEGDKINPEDDVRRAALRPTRTATRPPVAGLWAARTPRTRARSCCNSRVLPRAQINFYMTIN